MHPEERFREKTRDENETKAATADVDFLRPLFEIMLVKKEEDKANSQITTDPDDQPPLNKLSSRDPLPTAKQSTDSGMQIRMSPDQSSKIKEIEKEGVSDEQLKKEGPSRRMEEVKQGADPDIQTRMTQDQPSQMKEIGKGFVCNEQKDGKIRI